MARIVLGLEREFLCGRELEIHDVDLERKSLNRPAVNPYELERFKSNSSDIGQKTIMYFYASTRFHIQ